MIQTLKNKFKPLLRPTYHAVKKLAKKISRPPAIKAGKLIFYFGGREQVWTGMGRELYRTEPVFKKTIQQCNDVIVGIGFTEIISYFEGPIAEDYFETEKKFICAGAIQIATLETFYSKGIFPDAVLGVSMGELAAMYAAGANSLEDSLIILANWLSVSETREMDHCIVNIGKGIKNTGTVLKEFSAPTSVLFEVNEDSSLLFIPHKHLHDLSTFLAAKQISYKAFDKPILPYHTPLMEPFKQKYASADKKTLSKPLICDYYSPSLPGIIKKNTFVHTDYWHRVLSEPVYLHTILKQIVGDGYGTVLQIGMPGLNEHSLNNINLNPLSSFSRDTNEVENFNAACKALAKRKYTASQFSDINEANSMALFKENLDMFTLTPPAAFEYLRKTGDVHYIPKQNTWLVLNYDLVDSIFKQPHLFSSSIFSNIDATLLGAAPEPHNIIRDLVQPIFSPAAINKLIMNFERKVVKLIDEVLLKDEFDFLTDVSSPITQSVLYDFWGFSNAEILNMQAITGTDPYDNNYTQNVHSYFNLQLKLSQSGSVDSILGKIKSFIDNEFITHDEAVSLAKVLWLGGVHTSITFNTAILNKLMGDPNIALQLQSNQKLVPIFVGECLRLKPTINFLSRITTETVELGGVKIPANAKVTLSIESANRDPAHYADAGEFSLTRPAKRNLSFGAGIHQCLGMGVARAEAIALTSVILERLNEFDKYKMEAPVYHQYEDSKVISSLKFKKNNAKTACAVLRIYPL